MGNPSECGSKTLQPEPSPVPPAATAWIASAMTSAFGYMLAPCAFVALRCDSLACHAERLSKDAARAVRAR